jgi:hypothetical protein
MIYDHFFHLDPIHTTQLVVAESRFLLTILTFANAVGVPVFWPKVLRTGLGVLTRLKMKLPRRRRWKRRKPPMLPTRTTMSFPRVRKMMTTKRTRPTMKMTMLAR